MRFGIMEMQVEYLVPVGMLPGSVNTYVSAFDHANLVNSLARSLVPAAVCDF